MGEGDGYLKGLLFAHRLAIATGARVSAPPEDMDRVWNAPKHERASIRDKLERGIGMGEACLEIAAGLRQEIEAHVRSDSTITEEDWKKWLS